MSRAERGGSADRTDDEADGKSAARAILPDSGKAAEYIGLTALELARRARAAGFAKLAYLLECAALEAGAEAASRQGEAEISGT